MPQHKRKGRNCLSAASGQTGVMACHAEGCRSLIKLGILQCSCGRVIHLRAVGQQSVLKSGGIFADVVHQSSRFSLILRTEGAGKCLAKVGSALQMLINSLLPMIFGSVSRIGDSFRAITPCFFSCVGCYVQYSR